ncbi:MAG TPA: efflux RND transporter periplasmic adaptor subunit [Blastocatellia bacterium]|nr:efflux RND transporter periplasmic adaptor subunit [Blastocatellia bacterium]
MKTKQFLTIALISACGLLQGCTKTTVNAAKPPTPVKVEVVSSYAAPGGARYSASIVPASQVELAFSVGGFIDQILKMKGVDGRTRNVQQGDSVARGAALARVRSKDYAVKVDQAGGQLAQARASLVTTTRQVAEAEVAAEKAKLDFQRADALFATQSMTKSEYDSAKSQYDLYKAKVDTARAQLAVIEAQIAAAEAAHAATKISSDDTLLRSPIDGLLLERRVEVGELISPGSPAFVLADISVVKAQFGVPDLEIQNLILGSTLAVGLDALPGKEFTGQITSISPSADQKTRLFQVEVSIPNPGYQIKVGMIASLTLATATTVEAVAVVPLSAIVRSKDRPDEYSLFVLEQVGGDARARLRVVILGDAYGNRVAVKDGVSVGDRVVTSGGSRLVDGEIVQAIP